MAPNQETCTSAPNQLCCFGKIREIGENQIEIIVKIEQSNHATIWFRSSHLILSVSYTGNTPVFFTTAGTIEEQKVVLGPSILAEKNLGHILSIQGSVLGQRYTR